MEKTFFITGTDTDAGKTVASKALLDTIAARGLSSLAMKPVASGCQQQNGRWVNDDALTLRQAMTMSCDYELTNPYAFEPSIAPHIAAAQAHAEITQRGLNKALADIRALQPDILIIEGAGGWELPLSEDLTMPDFVKQANAEVIVVVGLKLGCLNHAVLTERAIIADGLAVAGWIGVDTQPTAMPFKQENLATLERRLSSPCLGVLPYIPNWRDADLSPHIANFID